MEKIPNLSMIRFIFVFATSSKRKDVFEVFKKSSCNSSQLDPQLDPQLAQILKTRNKNSFVAFYVLFYFLCNFRKPRCEKTGTDYLADFPFLFKAGGSSHGRKNPRQVTYSDDEVKLVRQRLGKDFLDFCRTYTTEKFTNDQFYLDYSSVKNVSRIKWLDKICLDNWKTESAKLFDAIMADFYQSRDEYVFKFRQLKEY